MPRKPRSSPTNADKSSRRGRTFTGCWNCRTRKVKCDEALPGCTPCKKHRIPCSGYASKLVWVTSDQKTYVPNGRRFLKCESTWEGGHVLATGELDHYISLCDAAHYLEGFSVEWDQKLKIPFGAFPSRENYIQSLLLPRKLSRSMIYGTSIRDEDAFLFHHYVNHVALIMMPYEDNRNPWASAYPAVALYHMSHNKMALFEALLAQAAFNLVNLGSSIKGILSSAASAYTRSMRLLRSLLSDQQSDYGSLVASIMTLMFVEIYIGESNLWRSHHDAAWSILQDHETSQSWTSTTFAESSTQSLCIVKIIGDTSAIYQSSLLDEEHRRNELLNSVSFRKSFGFTIGANALLMRCIEDIRRLSCDMKYGQVMDVDTAADGILSRLDQCRSMAVHLRDEDENLAFGTKEQRTMASYHLNSFICATYVYLYRAIFNHSPQDVKMYVKEVFCNVNAFFAIGDGNLTLWPAFIASVEAFDDQGLSAAKFWLNKASQVGMGSRKKVKIVVEEVWRRREHIAAQLGQELGITIVDWREVMFDLDIDILLV